MVRDIPMMISTEEVLEALHDVMDPEIPRLSVVDLGVITHVNVTPENVAEVTMTPTFSGCPALHVMKESIRERLELLPLSGVQVNVSFEVPWNSNRISEQGRAILQEMGFAPPPKHDGYFELEVLERVSCPFCGSKNTILQTPFGPTLCRSIHYCNSCLQAFEQFKPLV